MRRRKGAGEFSSRPPPNSQTRARPTAGVKIFCLRGVPPWDQGVRAEARKSFLSNAHAPPLREESPTAPATRAGRHRIRWLRRISRPHKCGHRDLRARHMRDVFQYFCNFHLTLLQPHHRGSCEPSSTSAMRSPLCALRRGAVLDDEGGSGILSCDKIPPREIRA